MLKIEPNFFKLKLFWKILIWFWLSSTLIIIINLFIGHLNSEKTHFRPLPDQIQNELLQIKNRFLHVIKQPKKSNRVLKKRFDHVYLINKQQNEYLSKLIPDPLADLHQRVERHNQPMSVFHKRQAFLGGFKVNIKDKEYRLYIKRLDAPFSRHFIGGFFKEMAKNMFFTIFIIGFPVSFFLSWLFIKPIRLLQLATHDIKGDLSNRKNLEKLLSRSDEFGELARDFDDMATHVNSSLLSQKQLLSNVSHELRSPLSRLKIALGMAQQKQIIAIKNDLSRIELESNRMNEMLTNLLTISKLEAQEINSTKEQFDLCQIVKMVIQDGQFEADESNITIKSSLPESCSFVGNKESLMSGVENILRNAIKYTAKNSVIKCNLEKNINNIIISFEDSGSGVPQEQLDKLFDAFYRTDISRNRNSGGVGLGLAIAKRAFEINGGKISAKNILPHGLKVEVRFDDVINN